MNLISTKWDQKRVLLVWFCNTHVIPPFRLSQRQVTIGVPEPGYTHLPHLDAVLPKAGRYDLAEELRVAGIDKSFDLVVVWTDASRRNSPINLDAFDCPKILCVGDTHHMNKPLQFLLNYTRQVRYDAIVLTHTRQHLHWFVEAGHDRCAWIPALSVAHIATPLTESREASVAFLGQAGNLHPFRSRLLQAIKSANIPLRAQRGAREIGATLYSTSVLSFNASLNADLNMRIFEVMSAAGCLVTDRLSPYSGLAELFDEGREMLCYGGVEELLETIQRFLADPKLAFEIAKAGHRRYISQYLPTLQRDVLFNWVFRGQLEPRYRADADVRTSLEVMPTAFADRVELYEAMQELHRVEERPRILVSSRVTPRVLSDAADLPRLQIARLCDRPEQREPADGTACLSREQAAQHSWDFLLVAPGENAPAGIDAKRTGFVAKNLMIDT